MKKYVLLFMSLLDLNACAVDPEISVEKSYSVKAISYLECFHVIEEGKVRQDGVPIFSPMPYTLHGLLRLHDEAVAMHQVLHDEFIAAVKEKDSVTMKKVIDRMCELGIGIIYEPKLRLVTALKGVAGRHKHQSEPGIHDTRNEVYTDVLHCLTSSLKPKLQDAHLKQD